MPIAGGILVAGSASRCLSSAAGMLRFLARLSGRRRHVRRSCGPGGGGGGGGGGDGGGGDDDGGRSSGCCGTVNAAGETRPISGLARIGSERGSIENIAGTSAASTTTTTTTTTMITATTTTTTTRRTRIGEKSRFESRTNDLTNERIEDSRWRPLRVSIERLSRDRLRESSDYQDESGYLSQEDCESVRRVLRDEEELSRRLELLRTQRPNESDKYSPIDNAQDNQQQERRRLHHHRLHYHRNDRHSAGPLTTASSPVVERTSFEDGATAAINSTTTATTTILRSARTRTRPRSGASDEDNNSRNHEQRQQRQQRQQQQHCPLKFRHSPVFSDDLTVYQNEMQKRPSVGDNRRNVDDPPDNSSFSNTSYNTRRRTFPPYLATLLIISYTLFGIADACSSRSTPKPRPPTPTPRPNITFHMYTCPPDYAEWYCLNGATCFTVKIQESLLYNCLCANGFIGQRCEFKDLDGSYLPSRQRVMLETASIAGGATIAVFLVVIICIAAYIHCKRKQKELRTSSACVDTVDGPGRDPELRPFSNRSRSLMIFMAKNPNGSSMCPSIEQTRMPGWSDYSRTETARMASVNEEKRASSR